MLEFPNRGRTAVLAAFVAICATGAEAAPAAVDQIFYAPFLSKVADGSTLTYSYARTAATADKLAPSFNDEVKVDVAPDGDAKSVRVDLFSGDRRVKMDNLSRSGNPVIISLMELEVREMSEMLRGSPYYIKNRMMDAMRNDPAVEPVKVNYDGKTVDGWKYTLTPFSKDQHREQLRDFADMSYELTFSDQVPGGLYALKAVTPQPDGKGNLLVEELTLKSETAATATEKKQ